MARCGGMYASRDASRRREKRVRVFRRAAPPEVDKGICDRSVVLSEFSVEKKRIWVVRRGAMVLTVGTAAATAAYRAELPFGDAGAGPSTATSSRRASSGVQLSLDTGNDLSASAAQLEFVIVVSAMPVLSVCVSDSVPECTIIRFVHYDPG